MLLVSSECSDEGPDSKAYSLINAEYLTPVGCFLHSVEQKTTKQPTPRPIANIDAAIEMTYHKSLEIRTFLELGGHRMICAVVRVDAAV